MENKLCSKCKIEKSLTEFHKNKSRPDGVTCACKLCRNAVARSSNHTEEVMARKQRYCDKYPQKVASTKKRWKVANKGKVNANTAKRYAVKKNATPNWLTAEQLNEIEDFYILAETLTSFTGIKYQVDHIIPLTHKDVQGLHVPWNLQVISMSDNCRKNNQFDYTIENESWEMHGSK